jgi:hypothetical protein
MKYLDTLKRRLVYIGAAFPDNTIEITHILLIVVRGK